MRKKEAINAGFTIEVDAVTSFMDVNAVALSVEAIVGELAFAKGFCGGMRVDACDEVMRGRKFRGCNSMIINLTADKNVSVIMLANAKVAFMDGGFKR